MRSALVGWPVWIGVVGDDPDKQRRFYGEVLVSPEIDGGRGWASFGMGEAGMLELIVRSSEPQYDRPGFQGGFAVSDIQAARETLVARGLEPISSVDESSDGSRWCYFRDAERNAFAIKQLGTH